MSWRNPRRSFHADASALVAACVRVMRARGIKAPFALADAAAALGMTPRRVRTLFYPDGEPVVLADEWDRLRIRAAAFLRAEADRQRQIAAEHEAKANELERQVPLFDGESNDVTGTQNRSAMGDARRAGLHMGG